VSPVFDPTSNTITPLAAISIHLHRQSVTALVTFKVISQSLPTPPPPPWSPPKENTCRSRLRSRGPRQKKKKQATAKSVFIFFKKNESTHDARASEAPVCMV
jgi:hypothetical protein